MKHAAPDLKHVKKSKPDKSRKSGGRTNKQKNRVVSMILLLLPFIAVFAFAYLGSGLALRSLISHNSLLNIMINSTELNDRTDTNAPSVIVAPDGEPGEVPYIKYESQWATINIDGWAQKDIPVYNGDHDNVLAVGAGQHFGSKFCGQQGKIVISSYPTSYFAEIENTQIGTLITVDTTYGRFYYRVGEINLYAKKGSNLFLPDDSREHLVLTTTYPTTVPYSNATQRIALICERVSSPDAATAEVTNNEE